MGVHAALILLLLAHCTNKSLSFLHFHILANKTSAPASTQDFVVERLKKVDGVRVTVPDGAFYVMPDFGAFCGPKTEAKSFGPIPDADTLCR